MIIVNGLKACDTCRKAMRQLSDAGIEARLRDMRADPPTPEEVAAWHRVLGDMMVNKRSTTWRGLSETQRSEDAVALMTAHPTLIKRPVVDVGGDVHCGWTADTIAAVGL